MHLGFYFHFQWSTYIILYIIQYDVRTQNRNVLSYGNSVYYVVYGIRIVLYVYVCFIRLVKSRNAIARTKELVVVSIGTHVYNILLYIAHSKNQQKVNRTAMLAKAY